MTLLGERGLRELATLNHGLAVQAADRLAKVQGVTLLNDSFFNEFTLILSKDAREVVRTLADKGVLAGVSLGRLFPQAPQIGNGLVVAVTETVTAQDIEALANALEEELA
jgi:glycine dehydrogenase subunit 1